MGPKISEVRRWLALLVDPDKRAVRHEDVNEYTRTITERFGVAAAVAKGHVYCVPMSLKTGMYSTWTNDLRQMPESTMQKLAGEVTELSKKATVRYEERPDVAPRVIFEYLDEAVTTPSGMVLSVGTIATVVVCYVDTSNPSKPVNTACFENDPTPGRLELYSPVPGANLGALHYEILEAWMNSRDCVKETVDPLPDKVVKARIKKHGSAGVTSGFVVLRHKTQREYEAEYGSDPTGRKVQAHWVRGHFKQRKNGLFWWRPHIAGTGTPIKREGYIIPGGSK